MASRLLSEHSLVNLKGQCHEIGIPHLILILNLKGQCHEIGIPHNCFSWNKPIRVHYWIAKAISNMIRFLKEIRIGCSKVPTPEVRSLQFCLCEPSFLNIHYCRNSLATLNHILKNFNFHLKSNQTDYDKKLVSLCGVNVSMTPLSLT